MKTKLLFLVVLIAAVVLSCQKKDSEPAQQDVVFSAIQIDPGAGLKSTDDWDWKCVEGRDADYAKIKIGLDLATAKYYTPAVFRLDGKLYTQAIKLDPGVYHVYEFYVMDDNGTPNDDTDDLVYMATPAAGATFSEYTDPDVDFTFEVTAFTKVEVEVEVLCYQEKYYTEFGFFWFNITEIVVREQCFFGDICLKHWDDYAQSNYALQPGGLQLDMVAIMEIKVYKNGTYVETFTNNVAPNYGVGAPLCVTYADNLNIDDEEFTFELYILVKQGNSFVFVLFHTWTFFDDDMITAGDDGVVDFVLGSCNLSGTDLQLVPYQNLPATCTLVAPNVAYYPGSLGTSFNVILSNIGPGYDLTNGTFGAYCFQRLQNIYLGETYTMTVYGSLRPDLMPPSLSVLPWDKINWLINHLGDYPGYQWFDVEQICWMLEDPAWTGAAYQGVPALSAIGQQMYTDMNLYGGGYIPLPGQWAAVTFRGTRPGDPNYYVQTVFVQVDP